MPKTTSKRCASGVTGKRPGRNKGSAARDGSVGKALARIEAKLDALYEAMTADDDEAQADSLDDATSPTRHPATL